MGQMLANVLIVDDLEDDIFITRRYLGAPRGMRCVFSEARDGKTALEQISTTLVKGDAIDLVLLDINMPVMNGFEMLERLRADPAMAAIPVVMQTGSIYEKDKERARVLGAVGYIEKPVKFQALVTALDSVTSVRLVPAEGAPPALVPLNRNA